MKKQNRIVIVTLICFVFFILIMSLLVFPEVFKNSLYIKTKSGIFPDQNAWLGFLGSYTGSIISALLGASIAILGVYITVAHNNKTNYAQIKATVKPLLYAYFPNRIKLMTTQVNEELRVKELHIMIEDKVSCTEITHIVDGETLKCLEKPEDGINIKLANIGVGAAVKIGIRIRKIINTDIFPQKESDFSGLADEIYEEIKVKGYEHNISCKKDWTITAKFDLEPHSYQFFVFHFVFKEDSRYNILEFKFNDIYENTYTQYMFVSTSDDKLSYMQLSNPR